jgi:hypothetical protein
MAVFKNGEIYKGDVLIKKTPDGISDEMMMSDASINSDLYNLITMYVRNQTIKNVIEIIISEEEVYESDKMKLIDKISKM